MDVERVVRQVGLGILRQYKVGSVPFFFLIYFISTPSFLTFVSGKLLYLLVE